MLEKIIIKSLKNEVNFNFVTVTLNVSIIERSNRNKFCVFFIALFGENWLEFRYDNPV